MKFTKLNGRVVGKDVSPYLVKWDQKSRSLFQREVKFLLYPHWKRHVVYEEFPVIGTRMTLDFVNLTKRVAIEVQGEQHQEFNKFFHEGERINFYNQLQRDVDKRKWCELNNLRIVEIFPKDRPITKEFLEEHDLV